MTAYGVRPDLRDTLMIGVSQSGGSPDLVQSLQVAREQGALTVAVTNQAGSPLAEAAELHLDVLAGPERAVAATKSYTAQLLALYLLCDHVVGGDGCGRGGPARAGPAGARAGFRGGRAGPALPFRQPPGQHGPRLLLPDRPGGRAQADGDLVPVGAGLLRRRPAARPAGHDRPAGPGAHRGRRRRRRPGHAAGAAAAGRPGRRRVLRRHAGGGARRVGRRRAARRGGRGAVPDPGDPAVPAAGPAPGAGPGRQPGRPAGLRKVTETL